MTVVGRDGHQLPPRPQSTAPPPTTTEPRLTILGGPTDGKITNYDKLLTSFLFTEERKKRRPRKWDQF